VNKKTVVKIKICTFLQGILATIAGYARIFGSLTNEREREREREVREPVRSNRGNAI
jgi:hypothetical protein